MAIATLTIDLVGKVADLQRDFNRASQMAENAARKMQAAFSLVGGVIGGLGASLGAGALVAGLTDLVRSIDDLDERAQGLGTTATALSNLQIGAREAGVGAEQLDVALTRLNVRLGEAASGNREAAQLFRALGVGIRDSAGNLRTTDAVLRDVADRFRGVEGSAAKGALAVELFGRGGAKLVAFLNQGGDGLERFSGLTDQTVSDAARAAQQIDRLSAAWERLKNQFAGAAIGPVLDFFKAFEVASSRIDTDSLTPGIVQLGREFVRAREEMAARERQFTEALTLGAGAYGNEGRSAARSAQAILENARAKDENAKASKRAREATLGGVFDAEFRDAVRIRENRRRLSEQIDQDNQEIANRRQQRTDDLFGRSQLRDLEEDLRLINEEFFSGRVGPDAYDEAIRRATGSTRDLKEHTDRASDSAERFALVFTSSLQNLRAFGGAGGDFFGALAHDLLKLTTQMLILEPLARALREAFNGVSGGAGFGDILSGFGKAIGFPSFDVGTPFVPRDMLAMVHRGEAIVPAAQNRGGGFGNVTVQQTFMLAAPVSRETQQQVAARAARGILDAHRRLN